MPAPAGRSGAALSPQQFLAHLKQQPLAPAYLFAGPEAYRRNRCREALITRALSESGAGESSITRHDLDEIPLEAVLEDARSLSLFTSSRVILVRGAESALPRRKSAADDDDDDSAAPKGADAKLAAYLKDPSPGVVLVFEASRYDFEGEDKKKMERVRKFYAAVPTVVEFARMSTSEARQFAAKMARQVSLNIGAAELDGLTEALGNDASRIAAEIEKLALFAGDGRPVGEAEIADMVPEARASTIFSLVAALGRNDRAAALDILGTLIAQGEYLPLALSFLATQFRLALAAREANLRTPGQVQAHFSKMGMPMWGSRAEQVCQTVTKFPGKKLRAALKAIYAADKLLRDTRPDDRVIMEQFILAVTG